MLYIVLMPFMSALAPTEWLPLPLLVLALAVPWLLLRRDGPTILEVIRTDAGVLIALLLGCIGMAWSPIVLGPKNLNHVAALAVSYLMFCAAVRLWLNHPDVRWGDVVSGAHACLLFLSFAIMGEFYLASLHGIFLADIIPFAHENLNVANFVSDALKRPRAFATEPGFTALAFECLWPLAAADFGARRRGWGRHLIYAAGFSMLASAAAVFSLAVAMTAVAVIRADDRWRVIRIVAAVLGASALLATTQAGQDVAWELLGRKFDLASLALEATDGEQTLYQRMLTYDAGLTLLAVHAGGIGWGTVAQSFAEGTSLPGVGPLRGSGMISLYLDVAVASGWLGLIAFAWFAGRRVIGSLRSSHPMAIYVGVAVTAVSTHHAFITEFQFPFLWFAIALVDRMQVARQPGHRMSRGARLSAA